MNIRFSIVVVVLVALAAPSIPRVFVRSSNCGGNSAALQRARTYAYICRDFAYQNSNHLFGVTQATSEQQVQLSELANYYWIPKARFLVATSNIPDLETSDQKRLVLVCDTPYNNVPRRLLGFPPMTYAAAYSDGSTALLTTKQFAALDRSQFRYLDEFYPSKKTATRSDKEDGAGAK